MHKLNKTQSTNAILCHGIHRPQATNVSHVHQTTRLTRYYHFRFHPSPPKKIEHLGVIAGVETALLDILGNALL